MDSGTTPSHDDRGSLDVRDTVDSILELLRDETNGRRDAEAALEALLLRERAAHAELERQFEGTQLLQNLTAALSHTLSEDEVSRVVTQRGVAALHAAAGFIARPTDDMRDLRMLSHSVAPGAPARPRCDVSMSGKLPIVDAFAGRRPIFLGDPATLYKRYPALDRGRSDRAALAALPLIAGEYVLGVLNITFAEPQPFDIAMRDLLQAVADQAAQALLRADLYDTAVRGSQAMGVVSHIADGVVQIDSEGRVRLWNPSAASITGIAADRAVGQLADDVLPGWSALAARIPVDGAVNSNSGRPVELPFDLPVGERWLSISGIRYDEGMVFALRDVTDERRVENLKRDFVATASHELRTPVTSIYGSAVTLLRPDVRIDDDTRSSLLVVIAEQADRLTRIIGDILTTSQLDSQQFDLRLEQFDISALARDVIAMYSSQPQAVRLDLPGEAGERRQLLIRGDRDRVRQVLNNLLENASKYAPRSQFIEVELRAIDERSVALTVRDDGPGIPVSERERVFDKFYRIDPQQRRGVAGTGLGLYICRRIVELMGGTIAVDDTPSGTSVTVVLPTG